MEVPIFGQRVQEQREKRGLEVKELAKLAQTSYQTIWRIEHGIQADPGIALAKRLARALGVTTDYLIGTNDSELLAAAMA